MRLITHNMLKCNIKGIENGYPLTIEAEACEEVEADNPFDMDFMKGLLRKVNLDTLKSAAANLGMEDLAELNTKDMPTLLQNEDILKAIHHILFEINIESGKLICPESGREFLIADGIPNMLLHEDEV